LNRKQKFKSNFVHAKLKREEEEEK